MTDGPIKRRPPVAAVAEQVIQRSTECQLRETRVEFIPTGSTILNLAASQQGRTGGWARGRIINLVGDGSSGKTLLALEACAQAYYRLKGLKSELWPSPKTVKIVVNNVEGVMDMPIDLMFGPEFVDAVEWIPDGNEERKKPMTCEAFGRDLLRRVDALPQGEALIYVLDSVDALTSEAGQARMNASIKSDKPLDGTYGTERAKYFSADFFNNLCSRMSGKDVTIFLISQVREKIDAMAFGEKYYRAGGKALDFYTHQVCWLAQIQKLSNKYDEKNSRVYGVRVKARFKRNKVAVPFREAEFDILFNYGIDDIGSCANFFTMDELRKMAVPVGIKGREDFIEMTDRNPDMLTKLIDATESKWAQIEEATAVRRLSRW